MFIKVETMSRLKLNFGEDIMNKKFHQIQNKTGFYNTTDYILKHYLFAF